MGQHSDKYQPHRDQSRWVQYDRYKFPQSCPVKMRAFEVLPEDPYVPATRTQWFCLDILSPSQLMVFLPASGTRCFLVLDCHCCWKCRHKLHKVGGCHRHSLVSCLEIFQAKRWHCAQVDRATVLLKINSVTCTRAQYPLNIYLKCIIVIWSGLMPVQVLVLNLQQCLQSFIRLDIDSVYKHLEAIRTSEIICENEVTENRAHTLRVLIWWQTFEGIINEDVKMYVVDNFREDR